MNTAGRMHLPDISAPEWLVTLARIPPAPVPWPAVIRAAVAIGLPLAIGDAIGRLDITLFVSMGALSGAISDKRGPYRVRALQISSAAVAGAIGFALGEAVYGRGWLPLAVLLLVAFGGSVIGSLGTLASGATTQLMIFTTVASGRDFPAAWWLPPLLYLLGGLWELALTLLGLLRDAASAERRAVATAFTALADLLDSIGTPQDVDNRRKLTEALNAAYDALLAGRVRSGGRYPAFRRFMGLLNSLTPTIETTVAALHAGKPLPPAVSTGVRAIGDAVLNRTTLPELPGEPALRSVRSFLGGERPAGVVATYPHPGVWERLATWFEETGRGSRVHVFGLRVTVCVGAAEVVRQLEPSARSYWIALTVIIVLKPDFGSVFARAVQRGVGTVIGALFGALLLALVPHGPGLIACIAVLAAILPAASARHYGLFSAFLTPLVVLLIDLLDPEGWSLLSARLIDTAIGCGIVLVLGYLLWPETFRARIGPQFLAAVDALAAYTRAGLQAPTPERGALRRETYRKLSDLRTVFQQALAEPPAVSRAAAAWWPGIVSLERLADAVTRVALRIDRGGEPLDPVTAERLADAVTRLTPGASRRQPELPELADPLLAGIAEEIVTARSVLAGPRPNTATSGERRLRR
ncbi:MAG TPA: FUSC family protein [Mycobacteriales bacterium]|nr:FUSC family protein [Mycobacteriales bacterium]